MLIHDYLTLITKYSLWSSNSQFPHSLFVQVTSYPHLVRCKLHWTLRASCGTWQLYVQSG